MITLRCLHLNLTVIYYTWKNIKNLHKNIRLIDDNIVESASKLNSDLMKIEEYAYQWKMSFNLDRTKPAHEAILSRKT